MSYYSIKYLLILLVVISISNLFSVTTLGASSFSRETIKPEISVFIFNSSVFPLEIKRGTEENIYTTIEPFSVCEIKVKKNINLQTNILIERGVNGKSWKINTDVLNEGNFFLSKRVEKLIKNGAFNADEIGRIKNFYHGKANSSTRKFWDNITFKKSVVFVGSSGLSTVVTTCACVGIGVATGGTSIVYTGALWAGKKIADGSISYATDKVYNYCDKRDYECIRNSTETRSCIKVKPKLGKMIVDFRGPLGIRNGDPFEII